MPTPPKRKPDSARRANRIIQQRTLLLLALLGIGTFLLLFAQLYKLQIKQHDELKTLAVRQQTLRTTVEASRGTIYDKNGDILALSSTAENVCVSPLDVAKNEQDPNLIANGLGEILGVDPSGILDDMKDTASQYKVIKKKVEQETADKVRVFISDNDIKGVFLEPTSKRYYPYSSLAAHVIGFVNANGGAYGLEAVYDEELTGEKGMVVSARDANGNASKRALRSSRAATARAWARPASSWTSTPAASSRWRRCRPTTSTPPRVSTTRRCLPPA